MNTKRYRINELITLTNSLKESGKKIVTTNGCFDVLHVGHLRYLQAARSQGDCLIVLLNSDKSTQGLKGPLRPIVSEQDRAELLAGLSCVDFVCLFDNPSPIDELLLLKPNIHVKGGDYSLETLPEARALQEQGVELAFIPTISGKSTTGVIERIIKAYTTSPCSP